MSDKSKFVRAVDKFIGGKGFYIVLFACVAAVGVSAWVLLFTNPTGTDEEDYVPVIGDAVIDGDPKFDRRFAEFNALDMANEWIKHTYHNGFSLPPMP